MSPRLHVWRNGARWRVRAGAGRVERRGRAARCVLARVEGAGGASGGRLRVLDEEELRAVADGEGLLAYRAVSPGQAPACSRARPRPRPRPRRHDKLMTALGSLTSQLTLMNTYLMHLSTASSPKSILAPIPPTEPTALVEENNEIAPSPPLPLEKDDTELSNDPEFKGRQAVSPDTFDNDDEYCRTFLYKINPTVILKKSPIMDHLVKSRIKLPLADFAATLGLVGVEKKKFLSEILEKRSRQRKGKHSFHSEDSDDSSHSSNKSSRSSASSSEKSIILQPRPKTKAPTAKKRNQPGVIETNKKKDLSKKRYTTSSTSTDSSTDAARLVSSPNKNCNVESEQTRPNTKPAPRNLRNRSRVIEKNLTKNRNNKRAARQTSTSSLSETDTTVSESSSTQNTTERARPKSSSTKNYNIGSKQARPTPKSANGNGKSRTEPIKTKNKDLSKKHHAKSSTSTDSSTYVARHVSSPNKNCNAEGELTRPKTKPAPPNLRNRSGVIDNNHNNERAASHTSTSSLSKTDTTLSESSSTVNITDRIRPKSSPTKNDNLGSKQERPKPKSANANGKGRTEPIETNNMKNGNKRHNVRPISTSESKADVTRDKSSQNDSHRSKKKLGKAQKDTVTSPVTGFVKKLRSDINEVNNIQSDSTKLIRNSQSTRMSPLKRRDLERIINEDMETVVAKQSSVTRISNAKISPGSRPHTLRNNSSAFDSSRNMSGRKKGSQPYNPLEDKAILNFIIKENQQNRVNGNSMWIMLSKRFNSLTNVSRSFHSLRNRYLRYILPNLSDYGLSAHEERLLRAAAYTGEIKKVSNPKENSIFKSQPVISASNAAKLRKKPAPPAKVDKSEPVPSTSKITSSTPKNSPAKPSPSYSQLTRNFQQQRRNSSNSSSDDAFQRTPNNRSGRRLFNARA